MTRGNKTIFVGVGIMVVGGVLPVLAVLAMVREEGHYHSEQFKGPGVVEVGVDDPGQYYLWNHFRTAHEGTAYERSESLPAAWEIAIRDSAGERLELIDGWSMTSTGPRLSRNTIGYVEVEKPGGLEIEISGGPQGPDHASKPEKRIFSFSDSDPMGTFWLLLGAIGLAFVAGPIGIGITIWGFVAPK